MLKKSKRLALGQVQRILQGFQAIPVIPAAAKISGVVSRDVGEHPRFEGDPGSGVRASLDLVELCAEKPCGGVIVAIGHALGNFWAVVVNIYLQFFKLSVLHNLILWCYI